MPLKVLHDHVAAPPSLVRLVNLLVARDRVREHQLAVAKIQP